MNVSAKKVIFWALLLLVIPNIYAAEFYHNCFETLEEQQAEIADMRNLCLSFGGGGATFDAYAPSVPVTCKISSESGSMVFENYYGVLYDCNTCDSKEIQKELEKYDRICNRECRQKAVKCLHVQNQWGSELQAVGTVFGDYICGDKDPSLPGCSESSSSQDDGSSSSEELSSSSDESSSSEEESSSSEDGEESSSSEENIESSSSEECYDPDSCETDRIGVECYKGSLQTCSSMLYTVYWNRPAMLDNVKLHENPVCKGNRIEFRANVPEVYFFHNSYECKKENCRGNHSFEGYWTCSDENSPVEGCLPEQPFNPGMLFYYDLIERKLFSFWGEVDFDNDSSLTEGKFGVAFFDVEEMLDSVAKRGVLADRHDTSLRVPLSMIYPERRYYSFYDHVKACAYHYGYEWDEFGLLRKIEPSSSSSKGTLEISSSSEVMSSEAVSSSSENVSCSSNEVSSSSEGISSSSNIELSSSAYGEWLSSSSEKEFSLAGSSSSSEIIDGIFIPGPDQTYTPDQIFRGGLQNMEDGKCYSLNPERGAQYGWINTNAQDTWWWIEVPCDGSLPIVEKTSAGCVMNKRGANAVYNPGDCFFGGLDNMISGKCYSLNPERGTQYGWINNDAQDSWWWVETPCEKDNNRGLYKKARQDAFVTGDDDASQEIVKRTNSYYDALGRKMNRRNSLSKKHSVYSKKYIVR